MTLRSCTSSLANNTNRRGYGSFKWFPCDLRIHYELGGKICDLIVGTRHFQLWRKCWRPFDYIRNCFIWLTNVDLKDSHFRLKLCSWDAKVIGHQSEDFSFLHEITLAFLNVLTSRSRYIHVFVHKDHSFVIHVLLVSSQLQLSCHVPLKYVVW